MKLLDIANDFELCDGVFCALSDTCIDAEQCCELERVVRLVWDSSGLIENGGFRCLFEGDYPGDSGFIYTVAAYKRVGARNAYDALRDAMRKFPDRLPPHDIAERMRIYDTRADSEWDEIADRFFEAKSEIVTCLAEFIRSHRVEYERLLEQRRAKQDTASSD